MGKYSKLQERCDKARQALIQIQEQVDQNPLNSNLIEQEKRARSDFSDLHQLLLNQLQQKSRVKWVQQADSNTSFFHAVVHQKRSQNRMLGLCDEQGQLIESEADLHTHIVNFYQSLLGAEVPCENINPEYFQSGPVLDEAANMELISPITEQEVKKILWSINPKSAPGPDGFSAGFFRQAWGIIGPDVTKAVQEFFQNSQMLKQINTTTIVLLQKTENPTNIRDYRPISCCNVILKVITKIIVERLKRILPRLVNEVQGAYVESRLM